MNPVQRKIKIHTCYIVNETLKLNLTFILFFTVQKKLLNYLEIYFTTFKVHLYASFLPSKYQSKEPTVKIKFKTFLQR